MDKLCGSDIKDKILFISIIFAKNFLTVILTRAKATTIILMFFDLSKNVESCSHPASLDSRKRC